jgi:hypothetical protein
MSFFYVLKACGGSLRRRIALVGKSASSCPCRQQNNPVSYQGIASAMPQMCEIGRPFRGQGRCRIAQRANFQDLAKGLATRRGAGGIVSGDVAGEQDRALRRARGFDQKT